MKTIFVVVALLAGVSAFAQTQGTDSIPARSIVLTGDASHPDHKANIAVMNTGFNPAFEDPAAPRFLFLDKKGTVALGIGGYLKAVGEYDFDGAIDNNDFVTGAIPVPFDPAQRQRFGATAAHSSIFLKLVTHPTRVGRVIVYIQTNFTGASYGLKLKQAYVSVGHLTLGKARSTFADGPAMAPTVDDQGPAGQVTAKNMMIQYASPSWRGFSFAAAVEVPDASYTTGAGTASIAQRCPDIPVYVQYEWDKGSHIRASAIYRALSYRNTIAGQNHCVSGWGLQGSAVADIYAGLQFFGHYTYGRGIASYVNDLSDRGYDLVPDGEGRLCAPRTAAWTAGLRYDFSPKFFVSASYSRAQLYGTDGMASNTYRYGQYIAANAFYDVWGELRVGVEYLHGTRKDISGISGHANRLEAMLQYSF